MKGNDGLFMPGFLFHDEPYRQGLSLTAKAVYACLLDFLEAAGEADGDGGPGVLVKQQDVQAVLNISRPTCHKAMQDLAAVGLIDISREKGGAVNRIHFRMYQNFTLKGKKLDIPTERNLTFPQTAANGKDAGQPMKRPKRIEPPTVQAVQAYCDERGYHINAAAFVDFYTSNGWKVGKNPMKDWKAAVRTWERKDKERQAAWPRRMTSNERLRAADDELERMCREYDGRNGKTDLDDFPGKLPG